MREVGVLEAKTHLSKLLDAVEDEGEGIIITRNGRPVGGLSPVAAPVGKKPSRMTGAELVAQFQRLREEVARKYPRSTEPMDIRELLGRDPL